MDISFLKITLNRFSVQKFSWKSLANNHPKNQGQMNSPENLLLSFSFLTGGDTEKDDT